MSYAIIRNIKYKGSNLKGIFRHNERRNKNYSNEDIDKERSYLNYVLPEGGRLIEDAEKGVREAMFVLGVMYLQGRLLMPDLEKSRHWLLRAERKGSKMAAGFLERLDIPEKRLHLMDDLKLMEGLMKMRQRARKAGLLLN